MSNRVVFTKKSVSILIIAVLLFDILFLPVAINIFDSQHYARTKEINSFDDLFSTKDTAINIGEHTKIVSYASHKEYNAADIFGNAEFKRVSSYEYGIIMLLYNPQKLIARLAINKYLTALPKEYESSIIELSEKTSFVIGGLVFSYKDKMYLCARIKDNSYQHIDDESDIDNALSALIGLDNKDICLFEIENANPSFVSEYFNKNSHFKRKYYPHILNQISVLTSYQILTAVLFILQFVLVFWLFYIFKTKLITSKKKRK